MCIHLFFATLNRSKLKCLISQQLYISCILYVLLLSYKAVLQSVLPCGLVCVFGNLRNQDRFQCMIKMASRVVGCDQTSAAQLCKDLILSKAECILNDPTHPLHNRFQLRHQGKERFLQKKIRTDRFSKAFVSLTIRLLNKRDSTKA